MLHLGFPVPVQSLAVEVEVEVEAEAEAEVEVEVEVEITCVQALKCSLQVLLLRSSPAPRRLF